ncbi:hypothetical protein [Nocardia carnea]|uniref:hypothetical protein n=1 Tax=Nocardia carnea TaxID=37328 RepID=UPI0024537990|nr:hypothetical protein [Nocardia carnea]
MRIEECGCRITASRALLLHRFESDEPFDRTVFELVRPVVVDRGDQFWVEGDELVIQRVEGRVVRCCGYWRR